MRLYVGKMRSFRVLILVYKDTGILRVTFFGLGMCYT
jgi:hypothetical protein